ncbi:MAG: hypothetical protein ACOYOS_00145 [Syntrophales bacterium]
MKATVWQKKKTTMFIGGDPAKGQVPEITLELENPQILFDSDSGTITVVETK